MPRIEVQLKYRASRFIMPRIEVQLKYRASRFIMPRIEVQLNVEHRELKTLNFFMTSVIGRFQLRRS